MRLSFCDVLRFWRPVAGCMPGAAYTVFCPWLSMKQLIFVSVAGGAGGNDSGQLGDGTTTGRLTPTAVQGSHNFRQVSSGTYHTCGVRKDGAALCWGE